MQFQKIKKGQTIFHYGIYIYIYIFSNYNILLGDSGKDFFLILKGTACVLIPKGKEELE